MFQQSPTPHMCQDGVTRTLTHNVLMVESITICTSAILVYHKRLSSGEHDMIRGRCPSRSNQNGFHFVDNIFIYIFVDKNCCIFIPISLKFTPKGTNNNEATLGQIMAWHQAGNKPLLEPMLPQISDAV